MAMKQAVSAVALSVVLCAVGADISDRNASFNASELIAPPSMVDNVAAFRTIIQTLEMTNVDDFLNVTALELACKSAIANASHVHDSDVEIVIARVKVMVTLNFGGPVSSAAVIREAIARQVGVSIRVVDVKETVQRRLTYSLRTARRLTTSVIVEIDASSDVKQDMVQTARGIHTRVQNASALEAAFSQRTGTAIRLSSILAAFEVDMRSVLESNVSMDALRDSALAKKMSKAIGGNVTTMDVLDDLWTSTATSTTTSTNMDDTTGARGQSANSSAPNSAYMCILSVTMAVWNALV